MKKRNNKITLYQMIMIFSGIIGFIYEEIFYLFDLGYLVKRGSSYGPWIPIYAFGSLIIFLITNKYKDKPIIVFLLSTLITTSIEYITGYILHTIFNKRLWDYSKEILNFGNINGYICFRSIFLFSLASLFLIYKVVPFFENMLKQDNNTKKILLFKALFYIFVTDIIIYWIIN